MEEGSWEVGRSREEEGALVESEGAATKEVRKFLKLAFNRRLSSSNTIPSTEMPLSTAAGAVAAIEDEERKGGGVVVNRGTGEGEEVRVEGCVG